MKKHTLTGELRLHRDGYGFVVAAKAGEEDVFIPARFVGDALHTDTVEVQVVPGRGEKSEGRIKRIVEHRVKKLVGRLEQAGKHFRVITDDLKVRHIVQVPQDKLGKARHGQNVVVQIVKYPEAGKPMVGEVVEILGERGREHTEERAIIIRHQLPHDFSQRVLDEADACFTGPLESRVTSHESRKDLRNIEFVTIDGETARDFDDAVAVKRLGGGLIRLWVSIADVSHFVGEKSVLDREAYKRGNSVYFPADCLPMLPEQLSNDLCSLKPDVDRFTMTAEMDVDPSGKIVRQEFYSSVIKSRARMTYTAVKQILVDKEKEVLKKYEKLVANFELMEECFQRLRAKRLSRGSIDFDLPEPQIIIDLTGDIKNIVKAERHVGHMMIEEFMIVANEAVAEFLTRAKVGCVYRVHEHPDVRKLREFGILLYNLGHHVRLGEKTSPGKLAHVVGMVRGKPEERLVNTSLLRSMQQAVYSSENIGHYGLASTCYCHFTSPIRRYPDLVVHRLLKMALARRGGTRDQRPETGDQKRGERVSGLKSHVSGLQEIAEHCSRRERIAMDAEREMVKLHVALFMKDKIGDRQDGIISHITKFGFFVELKGYFVEGLVRTDSLPFDHYIFDEQNYTLKGKKRKKSYRIGDPVRVEVSEVDIPNREVNFTLV